MFTQSRYVLLFIIGSTLVLAGVYYAARISTEESTSPTTNMVASTFQLSDVCSDCSVVGGTEESSIIYNLHTRTSHLRTVTADQAADNVSRNRYIAPSKSQEAVVSSSTTSLFVVDFSTGKDTKIYATPEGQGIGNVFWADYERVIFFGQGPVTGSIFPQVDVQEIFSYDIAHATTQRVLSTTQLGRGANTVVIIGVSTDRNKVIVSYNQDGLKYALWDVKRQRFTQLSLTTAELVSFVPPSVDGLETDPKHIGYLLWADRTTIHVLSLYDLQESKLPLPGLAPSATTLPLSSVSPAGDLLVYLRQENSSSPKELILLNILTGQERVLDANSTIDADLISAAQWIPDETKMVIPIEWNAGLPEYAAISVDPNVVWDKPKIIHDTFVPQGYNIEGFFYPKP